MNTPPDQNEPEQSGVSRREFLLRAGATTALIAGSVAVGKALWQPDHFVPGFEAQKGTALKNYKLEPSKVLPSMSIAHGTDHENVIRAAMTALGGMERFIQKGDIV